MKLRSQYVPSSLSMKDKRKQIKSIIEGKRRPNVKSFTSRPSKWTKMAKDYFGEGNTSKRDIARILAKGNTSREKALFRGLDEIVKKGEAAYYTSGSRPNQTPQSWGMARMFSVMFGGDSRKIDKAIVDKYKIPLLTSYATKGGGGRCVGEKGVEEILTEKTYSSTELDSIVEILSFNKKNVSLMGSSAIRSQWFPSDYDLFEVVEYSKTLPSRFQRKIKKLMSKKHHYIGDIKCGSIEEWKVVDETAYRKGDKLYGYKPSSIRDKLRDLREKKVITNEEFQEASSLVVDNPTIQQLNSLKKMVRFNVLRWKPQDILNGFLVLRDGRKYPLAKAVLDNTLFKLDAVIETNNQFTEFSIIYDIRKKGRRINFTPYRVLETIENDIVLYSASGNYFKAVKRIFSKLRYEYKYQPRKRTPELESELMRVHQFLNSDLGIVYQVSSLIDNLAYLIDNHESLPLDRIKSELDLFIDRLSNVSSNQYLKKEKKVVSSLLSILSLKSTDKIKERMEDIKETLDQILQTEAEQFLRRY